MIKSVLPQSLQLERFWYLDSVGCLLSLANRLLLRQSLPSEAQIQFWNSRVLPLSKLIDPILGFRVGKSALAILKRQH